MNTTLATLPLAVLAASRSPQPVAVCALRVRLSDDKTRLIPAGTFDAPRGAMEGQGPWQLDAQGAAAIIELAASRSTDIVIDYEHQTLLSERNGKPAPAAGWVDPRSLEWRDDGLYGAIEWTAAAQAAIEAGEYRYLSPVFPYDAETGAVLDLLQLALTNTPAIDDGAITQLAAARMATTDTHQEDDSVKREDLIKLLGLAAEATDEQINTELAALKASASEAKALREALELKDDDKPEEAVAALKAKADSAKPDMSQYVPKSVYVETAQQLAALKAGSETAEVDRLIDEGLKDGRIPGKATADWLREQGLAALKAHLEDAPSIAALKGGTQTAGKAPKGEGAQGQEGELSEEELAVCKNMGLSPEDYRTANASA
ncbi:phage protease [Billgrantia gudaonensis]|uniref:Mu-like prophage I protein n=1 Tax=Billgrantia gudaonensis TaxID=376427 RepID=A0A1G9AX43_9GAMM|nr:phage protease [Halomonas gudaonensis]SDK31812.1 Mu-like prophage I protein [Halomonas gudaonensis]